MRNQFVIGLLSIASVACSTKQAETVTAGQTNVNVAGFNADQSDPAAIELADSVNKATGVNKTFRTIQCLAWRNNEARLFWNKQDSLMRIEFDADSGIAILNLKTKTGRYSSKGKEITDNAKSKQKIEELILYGKYETTLLTLPFLLKTTGTTLTYMGQENVKGYGSCNVVMRTDSVGQKLVPVSYKMYIDKKENLVRLIKVINQQNTTEKVFTVNAYATIGSLKIWSNNKAGNGPWQTTAYLSLPDYTFKEL